MQKQTRPFVILNMIKIGMSYCPYCKSFLLREFPGKLHLVASDKKKKKMTAFFVCTCFLDFYIYIYNSGKAETFNIHMDHCELKTNLKFLLTYLGKNFAQICHECIFNVILTKKLVLASVSRVINLICRHCHDDNPIVEYENCYIRFKTTEWDEHILGKPCWLFLKELIFKILFSEFIVVDPTYIVHKENHV